MSRRLSSKKRYSSPETLAWLHTRDTYLQQCCGETWAMRAHRLQQADERRVAQIKFRELTEAR
jgi:hypothetical protein